MGRAPRRGIGVVLTATALLASVRPSRAQDSDLGLTVDAPQSLAPIAERVRRVDRAPLIRSLAGAGLRLPAAIHVTLIPEDDPHARAVPVWVVGLASGLHDIVLFPQRIGTYPYDSLESVVWHEVVHLALSAQAGDRPLPRWFHEGVAMALEEGPDVSSQGQLLLAAARNPSLPDLERLFTSETQPETASAYLLAAVLVSDVRRRHGAAVPGAIADRVAGGADFAAAFAVETGDTPDEAAARAWQPYERWTSWIPVLTSTSSIWLGIMALAAIAFLMARRKRARRRRQWDQDEEER